MFLGFLWKEPEMTVAEPRQELEQSGAWNRVRDPKRGFCAIGLYNSREVDCPARSKTANNKTAGALFMMGKLEQPTVCIKGSNVK